MTTFDGRGEFPQPIRSAEDIDRYLRSLIRPEPRRYSEHAPHTFEAAVELLARTGSAQLGQRIVHIAGSKGKGSTALFIEAILRRAGFRVGTFTSPHLERWAERIRVDGTPAPDAELGAALEALRAHIDTLRLQRVDDPPGFFAILTAAALRVFRDRKLDFTLLEAGLGGRYDATNAVTPTLCCITSIELEHTDKLGASEESIAYHKAGIIKPGIPLVIGRLSATARAIIRAEARRLNAPVIEVGRDFSVHSEAGGGCAQRLVYRCGDVCIETELAPLTAHAADNAALAIACAQALLGASFAGARHAVAEALQHTRLPARGEVLHRAPWIIVDGAHTQRSLAALDTALARIPADCRHYVVSTSRAESGAALLAAVLSRAQTVTVTNPEPSRSCPAETLAAALRTKLPGKSILVEADVALAIEHALAQLGPRAVLCVTGSMYLAGAALRVLDETALTRIAHRIA